MVKSFVFYSLLVILGLPLLVFIGSIFSYVVGVVIGFIVFLASFFLLPDVASYFSIGLSFIFYVLVVYYAYLVFTS